MGKTCSSDRQVDRLAAKLVRWIGGPFRRWHERRLQVAEASRKEGEYWRRVRASRIEVFSEWERVSNERFRRFEYLDTADSRRFEEEIAKLYRSFGYQAVVTKTSGDLGADVIAEREAERIAIECKRYNASQVIGTPILQKLHSAVVVHGATRGVLVTTATFSAPARLFAQQYGLELVDREELRKRLLKAYGDQPVKERIRVHCPRCGMVLLFPALPRRLAALCQCGETVNCDLSLFASVGDD
jgi:hypothetical protein